jgi:hypothetical protein
MLLNLEFVGHNTKNYNNHSNKEILIINIVYKPLIYTITDITLMCIICFCELWLMTLA